jgi:hypothetical protein
MTQWATFSKCHTRESPFIVPPFVITTVSMRIVAPCGCFFSLFVLCIILASPLPCFYCPLIYNDWLRVRSLSSLLGAILIACCILLLTAYWSFIPCSLSLASLTTHYSPKAHKIDLTLFQYLKVPMALRQSSSMTLQVCSVHVTSFPSCVC